MASVPPQIPQPPPPQAPAVPGKKKVSPLVWIALGCGVLLIVVVLILVLGGFLVARKVKQIAGDFSDNPAMVAARLIVAANPDLEVVSADEDAETITLRNKKTGEEITVDLEDVKKGRIHFKTGEGEEVNVDVGAGEGGSVIRVESDEGKVVIGGASDAQLPEWLPSYPGLRLSGAMSGSSREGTSGVWGFEASSEPADVLDFYQRELEGKGFEVTINTVRQHGRVTGGSLHATTGDGAQMVNVMATEKDGGSEGTIAYEMKSRG
jgi:hypothetical protein